MRCSVCPENFSGQCFLQYTAVIVITIISWDSLASIRANQSDFNNFTVICALFPCCFSCVCGSTNV